MLFCLPIILHHWAACISTEAETGLPEIPEENEQGTMFIISKLELLQLLRSTTLVFPGGALEGDDLEQNEAEEEGMVEDEDEGSELVVLDPSHVSFQSLRLYKKI